MACWRLKAGAVLGALTFAAVPAYAQTPAAKPAPAPAPAPQKAAPTDSGQSKASSNEVVVTGSKPGITTSIDGRSYLIDRDLNASTGSLADALRSLPSVTVDLQGAIKLRGENVTIWVDGKPSPLFSNPESLLNFPAKEIERVEVITTPSAAFSPEGSGGIINLITKQPLQVITNGTVIAQYGSAGASRVGGSFSRRAGKLTISGSAYSSEDLSKSRGLGERSSRLTPSALSFDSSSGGESALEQTSKNGYLNFRYDATPKTTFSVGLNYSGWDFGGPSTNSYSAFSGGVPANRFDSIAQLDNRYQSASGGGTWSHWFETKEHELSASTTFARSAQYSRTDSAIFQFLPPTGNAFEQSFQGQVTHFSRFSVDYKRPMPHSGKLRLGYSLQLDDNDYDRLFARAASLPALTPDPNATNQFGFEQTLQAAFATYERPLGAFTAQLGLRAENVEQSIDQTTSGQSVESDYLRFYPTLNLSYKIDEARNIRAGYSKRVQRPGPQQLNPFRTQNSQLSFSEGNPALVPQETNSYELGYQQRRGQTFYLGTLYWRQSSGEVSNVNTDLGGGLSVNRPENIGAGRSGGVELVANGPLGSALKYNLSTDIFWKENDAGNLGITGARSAVGVGGNANLTWTASASDTLQLNALAQGKRLSAQGYQQASWSLGLGWRHKFNDRIAATLTLRDVLATNRFESVTDTPLLTSHSISKQNTRGAFLQLSYAFGGTKQPDPAFDFSTPAGN